MISNILLFFYKILPLGFRNYLGQQNDLKAIRNFLLRPNGVFREAKVRVKRTYLSFAVDFNFFASPRAAARAENSGIENTILKNSLIIFQRLNADPDQIILDVGANFGYLSMVWASSIAQNGTVHSFEPNAAVCNSFQKSIKANNLQAIIHLNQMAVGKGNGLVTIYSSPVSSNIKKRSENRGQTTVQMVSLDHYAVANDIKKCDLIKIDVDGIEYDILLGAQNLIKIFKPIFIVETNKDKRIIDFFKDRQYRILDMKLEEYKEDNELPPNIFCLPY